MTLSIPPTPISVNAVGTKLVPLVLQRKGSSEIFYAPECSKCHKPILDLKMANVAAVDDWLEDSELIPIEPNRGIFRISGEAVAIHKECDDTSGKPWTNADNVFKRDQRWAWEKRA